MQDVLNVIPAEMAKQCSARMALINDLMADGAIATPLEYLEAPMLLVLNMSDSDLAYRHKRLMRTRKRYIKFGLNGRVYILARKAAIVVVEREIKARKLVVHNAMTPTKEKIDVAI